MKQTVVKLIYVLIVISSVLGLLTSYVALLLGFAFVLVFENPFERYNRRAIPLLLKISVVGLGFGMFINETLQTTKEGFGLTVFTILLTLGLGIALTKIFKIDLKLGHLITSGTAICGGSAIAAISPIIKANNKTISMALVIVFLLNSIALFLFPVLGHYFQLTQEQFGLWCAVAIHDTSSVVGATIDYGDEALRIATTVKLSRTLWIIPLSIASLFVFKSPKKGVKFPLFILAFIAAIVTNSYQLIPLEMSSFIVVCAKRLLIVTLFLVGTTIAIKDIKNTGSKPLWLGIVLWLFISVFSFFYIVYWS
ncbi:putative sulfate exporter family transporter [Winogradskyella sp. SYSU M77433]|uniref:YeiH family protein n=1 Tax=Winogradskyella sp. SYSU M77433 TaxID=3042722 RepID=UPI002480AADD|nr:putative sulfate exporter family transporter [Winogradskyella sp. SYSU M77433]MDH7913880.1 putative sulfate exporter family transporter [Winogradskyella sp. SYSU M77433]